MRYATFATLILALPIFTHAQGTWTLTTADFNKSAIAVKALDDAGLQGVEREKSVTIAIGQVLRLDRDAGTPTTPPRFTLFLTGTDKLTGDVGELKDEQLAWTSPVAGVLKLPLDGLRGISRSPLPAKLDEERKEDQVTLSNHDMVRGVVTGIDPANVAIQVTGGDVSPVPMASVEAILFASAKFATPTARAFRVRFAEGSQLTTPSVHLAGSKLTLALPGGVTRDVDLANVFSIEQVNGPVRWLADVPLQSSEQMPFNAETTYPAKFDRNVFGKPLRVGGQVFEKGIGVHANSKLVFALDGSYKAFRTRYGVDATGDAARADVNVRVLLDDRPVHERQHVRAFALPGYVAVPLGAAKTLTLEVTVAGPTDTQDRFDWVEAALLRELPAEKPVVPATVPTTAPATAPATVPTTASVTTRSSE